MDLITETSLEALIHKATDVRNKGIDNAAVDAFCGIIKKQPEYSCIASKLVAQRLQSQDEWEALQSLSLLETCMRQCGPAFHSEVGKFRFLNEMIKLVSPKYLGPKTSPKVKDIAIKLLHSWTVIYLKEPKIKEAYEMLKKQGVVPEDSPKVPEVKPMPRKSNLPVDHEFENKLKKLLNSKNPEDLEAANRMIKSRVLESERKTTELERVKNSVRLLAEMVRHCVPGAIPPEDLQLMSEIHAECEKLRPVVFRLAGETQDGEVLTDILNLSEELTQTCERYDRVISKKLENVNSPSSLLDFSSPVEPFVEETKAIDLLGSSFSGLDSNSPTLDALSFMPPVENKPDKPVSAVSDVEQLGAIFEAISTASANNSSMNLPLRTSPAPVLEKSNKQKALDELDVLGASLMQQCKDDIQNSRCDVELPKLEPADDALMDLAGPRSLDELMLGLDEPPANENDCTLTMTNGKASTDETTSNQPITEPVQVKPLSDVSVTLEKIAPSDVPPFRALESTNGVTITMHLAQDSPREDVSVYVVTTTSTSNLPLSDYLFQVVVPKGCKFKLQPPSATYLPAHNPFLPPSAITQILLIANPSRLKLHLTFMLSFTRDDETLTEVGEVAELPTLRK